MSSTYNFMSPTLNIMSSTHNDRSPEVVELWNRGAWLCLCLCLSLLLCLCLCLCLCLSLRLLPPETDEKPYNLLILTKKKSTSLLS